MILVLGSGWTGTRLCLRDPRRFITTTRTLEKLSKLTARGINAIQFDLQREETWSNLPPKSDIEATIFTFEILATCLPDLKRLLDKHIPTNQPILCLGTTSCFEAESHESIVSETAPLTGKSIFGTSLADRVKGEEWILAKGATVLHLSGIAGGEDEESGSEYGPSRSIKSFLSAGYIQNGLRLMNFIHINDICKIILILIKKIKEQDGIENSNCICGQRIITSCGAFRVQDWIQALNMDPLPEIPPPDISFKRSKILSISKLVALLPEDYEWTLPVPGVEPVSRGLPTTGLDADVAAAQDRQWELLKENFRGKWQGNTIWYKNKGNENDVNLDHQTFITEMKGATLPAPTLINKSQIQFYFLDAETGVWRGSGLRSTPEGEKVLPLCKKTYTTESNFQFQGVGGRCAVDTNTDNFGAELNFFYERSKSMIIAMYCPDSTGRLLLDSVCIGPLRCGLGCSFSLKPPQSEARGSIDALLLSLQGKTCRKQWRSRSCALIINETNGGELCEYPTTSIQSFSDQERVVQLFDDDLVCSIPASIQAGVGCELYFGCFHTPNYAQIVTLTYDSNGKIERYTLEKWSSN